MAGSSPISSQSSVLARFHYSVLSLFVRLVPDADAGQGYKNGCTSQLQSVQLPDFDGNDDSVSPGIDGGLSNFINNVDVEHQNHSIGVLDTDINMDREETDMLCWMRYLLGLSMDDIANDIDVDSIINNQTKKWMTCAQFCIADETHPSYQFEQGSTVDMMHVHRGESGRTIQRINVDINNTQSFSEWCTRYADALRLDLRSRGNITRFRKMMGLGPSQVVVDEEQYDSSQFYKHYYELITDFQLAVRYGLSPMENNDLLLAIRYTLLRASPDLVSRSQVVMGSLTIGELASLSSSDADLFKHVDILQEYDHMLHSPSSPMDEEVWVTSYSLTTNAASEGASEAVARLRQLSIFNNIESTKKYRREVTVNVSQQFERLVMLTNSILPDETTYHPSQDSTLQVSLAHNYWLTNNTNNILEHSILDTYINQPTFENLLSFVTRMHGTLGVRLNRVNVNNTISNISATPNGDACDARELNIMYGFPIICSIIYQGVLSPMHEDWSWDEACTVELKGFIKRYCGTYDAHAWCVSNKKTLDCKGLAAMMVLSLWEAAVTFNTQSLLMKCFTKTTDSLASMYASTIIGNQALIDQLGETSEI